MVVWYNNITKKNQIQFFFYNSLDDIIIGAPLYSSPMEKDQSYEKGRVYVALQNRDVCINRDMQIV